MLQYAKVINEKTKAVIVGLGNNANYYKKMGFSLQEVEQGYDEKWYLKGYAPIKPEPTLAEKVEEKEKEYQMTRWQREIILAESSGASEYSKDKAREIEELARQLRTAEKASEVEEEVISETENTTTVDEGAL